MYGARLLVHIQVHHDHTALIHSPLRDEVDLLEGRRVVPNTFRFGFSQIQETETSVASDLCLTVERVTSQVHREVLADERMWREHDAGCHRHQVPISHHRLLIEL